MKKREYRDFVNDIVESIQDIEQFVGDISFDEFIHDKKQSMPLYAVSK